MRVLNDVVLDAVGRFPTGGLNAWRFGVGLGQLVRFPTGGLNAWRFGVARSSGRMMKEKPGGKAITQLSKLACTKMATGTNAVDKALISVVRLLFSPGGTASKTF